MSNNPLIERTATGQPLTPNHYNTPYRLLNGYVQNEEHPDTFAIPDQVILLYIIRPGDFVKLCFIPEAQEPGEDDFGAERMWVEVVKNRGYGDWTGTLANTPFSDIYGIHAGDELMFSWLNVIDYELNPALPTIEERIAELEQPRKRGRHAR